MTCGGNFKDHMTLKWAKHLYSPFDLLLDKIHEKAVEIRQEKFASFDMIVPIKRYNYHREYVLDTDDLLRGIKTEKQRIRVLKNELKRRFPSIPGPFEFRKVWPQEKSYVVPSITATPFRKRLLNPVREIIFGQLSHLYAIQDKENRHIRRYSSD